MASVLSGTLFGSDEKRYRRDNGVPGHVTNNNRFRGTFVRRENDGPEQRKHLIPSTSVMATSRGSVFGDSAPATPVPSSFNNIFGGYDCRTATDRELIHWNAFLFTDASSEDEAIISVAKKVYTENDFDVCGDFADRNTPQTQGNRSPNAPRRTPSDRFTAGHELLMQRRNGVIKTDGVKEWGQSRAVPINPENSSTGQSQAVPTNPEHAADNELSSERF
ncbi:hypothetical protein J6590_023866 [Homalodisca vitripennis]|nr:hypothetical protein J6590_023866 [Homalodisca vitripennis]